ncbi:MAG: hypothetical protein Q4P84_04145 [Elusimicrobiales bacterium]|nr:hypothetical protein [Elusimicrobiales bacterium]
MINSLSARTLFTRITPDWKHAFAVRFSPDQLQTVEDALFRTDALVFKETDGQTAARSDEWNFSEIFSQELTSLLQERSQTLSPSQWKQLLGGRGVKGATLSKPLRLLTLHAWLLTHGGEFPHLYFYSNGRTIPFADYTPAQKQEASLRSAVYKITTQNRDSDDPVIAAFIWLKEKSRRSNTPEEWLAKLKLWLREHNGEYPRQAFFLNGVPIEWADYTPAQIEEASLNQGVRRAIIAAADPTHPVIAEMRALKEAGRRQKAPASSADWLAALKAWLRDHDGQYPRYTFYVNGVKVAPSDLTPAQKQEVSLASGVSRAIKSAPNTNDPVTLELIALKEAGTYKRTSAEWLEELKIWLREHNGQYPRYAFYTDGVRLKAKDYTPAQKKEAALAHGIEHAITASDPSNPVIAELIKLKNAGRHYKTHAKAHSVEPGPTGK